MWCGVSRGPTAAAGAGVIWLYEEQTKRLPPVVLGLVRRRWGVPATMLVIAAWLAVLTLKLVAARRNG